MSGESHGTGTGRGETTAATRRERALELRVEELEAERDQAHAELAQAHANIDQLLGELKRLGR